MSRVMFLPSVSLALSPMMRTEKENVFQDEEAQQQEPMQEESHTKQKPNKASLKYVRQEETYSKLSLYQDWPLTGIVIPHPQNDVLFGRGGKTNHHSGNIRYRSWVDDKYRSLYETCSTKSQKTNVAMQLIQDWRLRQTCAPPGRFLKFNDKEGTWDDVGDRRAREKTSQALRESKTVALRGGRSPCKQSAVMAALAKSDLKPNTSTCTSLERRPTKTVSFVATKADVCQDQAQPFISSCTTFRSGSNSPARKRCRKRELLDRASNMFPLSNVADGTGLDASQQSAEESSVITGSRSSTIASNDSYRYFSPLSNTVATFSFQDNDDSPFRFQYRLS
jgi:hypothetical protein